EAQLVDAADSLAYDTHDLDDALGVGLIALDELDGVRFWQRAVEQVQRLHPRIGPEQFQPTVVRFLINWQVTDLLAHTRHQLRAEKIGTVADVRAAPRLLVEPGPEVKAFKEELEAFLHRRVYNHYRVQRMAAKGRRFLTELFAAFCRTPTLLPERYQRR